MQPCNGDGEIEGALGRKQPRVRCATLGIVFQLLRGQGARSVRANTGWAARPMYSKPAVMRVVASLSLPSDEPAKPCRRERAADSKVESKTSRSNARTPRHHRLP